jgi:N-acetylneuraminic acid mutarotase
MRRAGFTLVFGLVFLGLPFLGLTGSGGHWEARAPMPSNRSEVAVAELGGKIYVMGGFKFYGLVTSRAVEVYDPQTNRWEEKAPLPAGRHHAAEAVVGGRLYLIGGYKRFLDWETLRTRKHQPTNQVWEYDPGQNRWRERAPMPTARGALAIGVIDGKIYAVGGGNAVGRGSWGHGVNSFERYDPVTDTWQALPPMPTPRHHLTAAVLDGRLYAIGGRQAGLRSSMGVNEMYDPNTQKWITRAPMPSKRSGIAAAVLGRRIYVFGGEGKGEDYVAFDAAESYTPDTDQWTRHNPMSTARHGLGAAVFGGRIFVIAGGPQSASARGSGINEVFTPPTEKP